MVRPGQVKVISGPTRAAPTPQVKGPAVKPLPTPSRPVATTAKNPQLFPTATGGALAGKTASAPGNAANKVVLDAWRASGGTTTNKYVDKYTNPTNPGESALQEAKRLQEQGAAKIFDRVHQEAVKTAVAEGRTPPKASVYTRTLDDKGTKQNVLTGEILPPEKKIIASPVDQTSPKTRDSPLLMTSPGEMPRFTLDTQSTANTLPPAKGTLQGTINQNISNPYGSLQQNLKGLQAITPMLQAMGLGGFAQQINNMVQQLAPGVTARISAKGQRRR